MGKKPELLRKACRVAEHKWICHTFDKKLVKPTRRSTFGKMAESATGRITVSNETVEHYQ